MPSTDIRQIPHGFRARIALLAGLSNSIRRCREQKAIEAGGRLLAASSRARTSWSPTGHLPFAPLAPPWISGAVPDFLLIIVVVALPPHPPSLRGRRPAAPAGELPPARGTTFVEITGLCASSPQARPPSATSYLSTSPQKAPPIHSQQKYPLGNELRQEPACSPVAVPNLMINCRDNCRSSVDHAALATSLLLAPPSARQIVASPTSNSLASSAMVAPAA